MPVARKARRFVGVDRSAAMLRKLRARLRRARLTARASLVRGDIRELPFRADRRCRLVMAPYGMLQSLLSDDDLAATLDGVARVLAPGGTFGVDLAPGLPRWGEYARRVGLRGPMSGGRRVTLIESVRQVPRQGLTVFDQEFVETRRGRRKSYPVSIAFRTLSVPEMIERLEAAGFAVDAVLGGYREEAWSPDAEIWVVIARRR